MERKKVDYGKLKDEAIENLDEIHGLAVEFSEHDEAAPVKSEIDEILDLSDSAKLGKEGSTKGKYQAILDRFAEIEENLDAIDTADEGLSDDLQEMVEQMLGLCIEILDESEKYLKDENLVEFEDEELPA